MRRSGIVGATLGLAVIASACASANSPSASRFGLTPSMQVASRHLDAAERDSMFAQAIADRDGPRVSISTELSSFADSRRLRATFHLEDDAYVVVGHLDADGTLRIVFPVDPLDDGFVRGRKSYQTAEFFAGFNDQYRYRRSTRMFAYGPATYDSYDGGLGYVFVVASWRPMRFDRFTTDGRWDSFELAEMDYIRDPRPAIYELASLLAGENREAYTVTFARYSTTRVAYTGFGGMSSAFGSGYCSGYEPAGFASSPFGLLNSMNFLNRGSFGSGTFYYRGTRYAYDAFEDCYRAVPTFYYNPYGFQYGIAQTPPITPRRRAFAFDGSPRSPLTPRVPPGHAMPQHPQAQDAGPAGNAPVVLPVSPQYRQRGLITDDDPSTGPIRRQPRVEGHDPVGERTRPTLQEMTNRRGENAHEGTGWPRSQVRDDGASSRQGQSERRMQPRDRTESGASEPRTYSRPAPSDAPRAAPVPRSEPATPRVEAPVTRSAPPVERAPRSEPASSKPPVAPVKDPGSRQ